MQFIILSIYFWPVWQKDPRVCMGMDLQHHWLLHFLPLLLGPPLPPPLPPLPLPASCCWAPLVGHGILSACWRTRPGPATSPGLVGERLPETAPAAPFGGPEQGSEQAWCGVATRCSRKPSHSACVTCSSWRNCLCLAPISSRWGSYRDLPQEFHWGSSSFSVCFYWLLVFLLCARQLSAVTIPAARRANGLPWVEVTLPGLV